MGAPLWHLSCRRPSHGRQREFLDAGLEVHGGSPAELTLESAGGGDDVADIAEPVLPGDDGGWPAAPGGEERRGSPGVRTLVGHVGPEDVVVAQDDGAPAGFPRPGADEQFLGKFRYVVNVRRWVAGVVFVEGNHDEPGPAAATCWIEPARVEIGLGSSPRPDTARAGTGVAAVALAGDAAGPA